LIAIAAPLSSGSKGCTFYYRDHLPPGSYGTIHDFRLASLMIPALKAAATISVPFQLDISREEDTL
jgi:hypothetical protein